MNVDLVLQIALESTNCSLLGNKDDTLRKMRSRTSIYTFGQAVWKVPRGEIQFLLTLLNSQHRFENRRISHTESSTHLLGMNQSRNTIFSIRHLVIISHTS